MKYRMYFFVPVGISEIQKGIQAGHAALEYAYFHGSSFEYKSFIKHDKTWIILNGGTTRGETFSKAYVEGSGTLDSIGKALEENQIPHSKFYEPDLNFALTAVCFLADERVWDFENYPDFESLVLDNHFVAITGKRFSEQELIERHPDEYAKWVKSIGGSENVFLRCLIRNKKLA